MMALNMTHLRSFWAVAKCGGFSSAASFLRVAQPTLTRQIRELEEGYGIMLFHREARATTLTREGEELLPIAERVFAEAGEAEAYLKQHATPILRVATVTTDLTTKLLQLLRSQNAMINIRLTVATSGGVHDAITERRCDIGVLTLGGDGQKFDAVELGRFPILAVLPQGHVLSECPDLSITDLADERLITGSLATQSRVHLARAANQAHVNLNIVQEIDSYEMILETVRIGFGIGIIGYTGITERYAEYVKPIRECAEAIPVHLACLKGNRRSKHVGYVFNLLAAHQAMLNFNAGN